MEPVLRRAQRLNRFAQQAGLRCRVRCRGGSRVGAQRLPAGPREASSRNQSRGRPLRGRGRVLGSAVLSASRYLGGSALRGQLRAADHLGGVDRGGCVLQHRLRGRGQPDQGPPGRVVLRGDVRVLPVHRAEWDSESGGATGELAHQQRQRPDHRHQVVLHVQQGLLAADAGLGENPGRIQPDFSRYPVGG